MLSRFITTVVLIAAAAPAGAQTVIPVEVSAADLSQMQAFENTLRTAIARAGGQLAARARQVAPNITLQFESDARIKGLILPDSEGVQFFVDVPGIRPDTVSQWELNRLLNASRPAPSVLTAPVANPGNPGARPTDVTVPRDSVAMTNPVTEYSTFAHDALVDAILDSGFNLPIRKGQNLTLIVGNGTSGLPANPLAEVPKFLYLRIKGEDLLALRQNSITRDEARARVRQMVY
jgi:hypothetical protein